MELKRVEIENFKGIEHKILTPNKLTAFIGANGTGKSSTEKAIIYALSGALPDDAIRDGKSMMAVSVELGNGDSYSREYKKDKDGFKTKVRLNGRTCTQKALDEQISATTGMDGKSIKVVTSTEVLSALKADEFGEFILGYLNEQFDFNKVLSYCGSISKEAVNKLKSYTPDGDEYIPHTGTFGMNEVDKIYYVLASQRNKYAERPALKSQIQVLKARSAYDGPIPKRSIEEIDRDLNAIAKAEGSYQMMKIALDNYKKSMEAIEAQNRQIEDIKRQIAAIHAVRPDDTQEEALKKKKSSLDESIIRTERMAQGMRSAVSSALDMLNNLNKDECLCFKGLRCTTDKSCKKEELETVVKDNNEGIEYAQQEIKKFREEKADVERKLVAIADNRTMYGRKLVLEQQLNKLLSNPITKPIKPQEIEKRDYTSEKVSYAREKEIVMRYNQCMKEADELVKKEKELEVVEELIKIFGPKGIFKENVINYYLSTLEKVMNDEAAALKTDFTVKLVYNSGVHILCEPKAGQGYIPYHSVSSGEQVFMLYLIVDLLNKLTGLRILILDDLNHLDKDAFKALIELIDTQNTMSNYDHVFVSSVDNVEVVDALSKTGFDIVSM